MHAFTVWHSKWVGTEEESPLEKTYFLSLYIIVAIKNRFKWFCPALSTRESIWDLDILMFIPFHHVTCMQTGLFAITAVKIDFLSINSLLCAPPQ